MRKYFLLIVLFMIVDNNLYGMNNEDTLQYYYYHNQLTAYMQELYHDRANRLVWLIDIYHFLMLHTDFTPPQLLINEILLYACQYGYEELVKCLIDLGADVNIVTQANSGIYYYPLILACVNKHFGVLKCLLDTQKIHWHNYLGDKILLTHLMFEILTNKQLAQTQVDEEGIGLLLSHVSSDIINFQNSEGDSLLHMVCHHFCHKQKAVELLLLYGANPNIRNAKKQTPLHVCMARFVEKGNCDRPSGTFNTLLFSGADVQAQDDKGDTPLHYVARMPWPEYVPMLILHRADLEATNDVGKRAVDLIYPFAINDSSTHFGNMKVQIPFMSDFYETSLGKTCIQDAMKQKVEALALGQQRVR